MLADQVLRSAEERERLNAELRQQAEIIAAALDHMAQGLAMFDATERLVIYNRRFAELYGIPEELLMLGDDVHQYRSEHEQKSRFLIR